VQTAVFDDLNKLGPVAIGVLEAKL